MFSSGISPPCPNFTFSSASLHLIFLVINFVNSQSENFISNASKEKSLACLSLAYLGIKSSDGPSKVHLVST